MGADDLSINDLAQRCAEETDKFLRRQTNDSQFCFELLRRALADGIDEAYTRVWKIYEPQVLNWVYQHQHFMQTDESAEFFACGALEALYFALRGSKFDLFPTLPRVLSYLKACVHTQIVQYRRDRMRVATTPLNDIPESADLQDIGARLDVFDLLSHISRLLPDGLDRLLADCFFLRGLKPRDIVQAYPTLWSDEQEIYTAITRIRRVLRKDPELRRRAGIGQPETEKAQTRSV